MMVEVPLNQDKERLDSFLAAALPALSRNQAARLIEKGRVSVNGAVKETKNFKVRAGDMVEITKDQMSQGFDTQNGNDSDGSNFLEASQTLHYYPVEAEDIPLTVVYDDEDLAVISKPKNLVAHPSHGHETHTLVNALIARYGKENLGTLQGPDKLGLVHRLDMDTTGLMLIAKNDEIQQKLQDAIKAREVDRRYLTLVHGNVAPESGLIDVGMARSSRHRIKMMATANPGAREAITTFRTLERFAASKTDEGFSLLECHLMTGRTHQIRLHMNYIHHCVVGDPLYGVGDVVRNLSAPRQFLHSYRLSFQHPRTKEELAFVDPLPADLQDVLNVLRNRSLGRTEAGENVMEALQDGTRACNSQNNRT